MDGFLDSLESLGWDYLCCVHARIPSTSREETQGDLFLNLASSAGLPADFPLDAADFANFPGTADKLDKIFSKICSAA